MERYLKIGTVNVRHNLFYHILICILLVVMAPLFTGTENLEQSSVAKIIEVYLSLIGMILLIPTFIPDMNKDIRDLIYSKKEPVPILHSIRVLEALVIMMVIGIVFLHYLKSGNCWFSFDKMFYTFLANGMFLGGLGMLMFAIFDQAVFAYMIPLVYYVLNFGAGKKQLGKFWLFSMQAGSIEEKHYLMGFGLLFLVGSVVIAKCKTLRRR